MDPSADRRARFEDEIGGPTSGSLSEALDHKPQLSVIASPNRFHVEQAQQCADAGSNLFIEKPLGISMDGVDRLIQTVEEKKLFAHVGSNWKFHPAFQRMKKLLDGDTIGKVTGAQVLAGQWLPDWHPWEDYRQGYSARQDLGGGIVFDAHEFDYITWLLGPVDEVAGFATKSGALNIETEDVACASLRFESGVLATVLIDYIQRQPRRRYHISGDGGTLEWDMLEGRVRHYSSDREAPEEFDGSLGNVNDMYLEQMRHVLEGIAMSHSPETPLDHAARAMDLQLALLGNA